jgi:glutamate formiminotransferase/glutamate formiminotransferase/formiminotetrahydrofolate cyclodeaminase
MAGEGEVLECVVNVSEGRDTSLLRLLALACGECLLDLHADPYHHRSVFTLAGDHASVVQAVRGLAGGTVGSLDLRSHTGAHPRFGTLDVVPWVALEGWPLRDAPAGGVERALKARDDFASWLAADLGVPVFVYGPERSLPQLRREAWRSLSPDFGPTSPHPTAGAAAVGCRPLLVAYNLWMAEPDLVAAREVAAGLRSPTVRALAFQLGEEVQVSCNLVAPLQTGPEQVFDHVAALVRVAHAELVGLVPRAVLDRVPPARWEQLDLSVDRTIEARLNEPSAWAPS